MTIEELMAKYYPTKSIKKQLVSPGTYNAGTFWEPLFGAKAWSWLNEEKNISAIIPKETWGRSGFRVLSARAASSGGGIDNDTDAALPSHADLTFVQLYALPKTMAHLFDIGEMVEFVSGADDAVQQLPIYREQIGKDHAFCINHHLGVIMETAAAGDNFESIDRIVSSQGEIAGNSAIADDAEANLWSSQVNKNAATTYDAQVNHNSASDRDLTLTLIDTVLQTVWDAGGQPKVLVTGTETLMRWQQLLQSQQRFMKSARIVPSFGGATGPAPGIEAGFMVATYHAIPILPSQHIDDRDTIESIYYLDTDFIKFATAKPTVYSETGAGKEFLLGGGFTFMGMYETMGELRCYRFNAQGKLTDLK